MRPALHEEHCSAHLGRHWNHIGCNKDYLINGSKLPILMEYLKRDILYTKVKIDSRFKTDVRANGVIELSISQRYSVEWGPICVFYVTRRTLLDIRCDIYYDPYLVQYMWWLWTTRIGNVLYWFRVIVFLFFSNQITPLSSSPSLLLSTTATTATAIIATVAIYKNKKNSRV